MSDITQEKFDEILHDIVCETSGGVLLSIPGVYEILSEYFNNDVLAEWETEKEEQK